MDIANELLPIIGQGESQHLECQTVLVPSVKMAQLISSFANADGGYIVFGISDNGDINGLSADFRANEITHKALDKLSPQPQVYYQYLMYEGKNLYVVKVDKSNVEIAADNKIYKRVNNANELVNPTEIKFSGKGYERLKRINEELENNKNKATISYTKLLEHYQSILKIIDDLEVLLYPKGVTVPTSNPEGKILTRILFSSTVDSFEAYLADLLSEIFIANPLTLKSGQQVTIEQVLNCSSREEFVEYWINQKLSKLQKGSIKAFIAENAQIKDLNALSISEQEEIEQIFQIRHLYSHRNGIVDEKFLQHFQGLFTLNSEHSMSVEEVCDKICYLTKSTLQIDLKATLKYKLSTNA